MKHIRLLLFFLFFAYWFTYPNTIFSQTRSSIFGKYVSNWGETLIIKHDSTFKIITARIDSTQRNVLFELTGRCIIDKRSIRFTYFDQQDSSTAYWRCFGLSLKHKQLKRPLHCGPTHRFLIFSKAQG